MLNMMHEHETGENYGGLVLSARCSGSSVTSSREIDADTLPCWPLEHSTTW